MVKNKRKCVFLLSLFDTKATYIQLATPNQGFIVTIRPAKNFFLEFPKKSYFGVLGVIFISKKIKILDKIASNWPFLPNLIKINLNIFILLFAHTICLEYLKDSAHQFPTLVETPPDTHPRPPNQVGVTPYSSVCLLAYLY